jgi:trk system potassium uptake protein TrkH
VGTLLIWLFNLSQKPISLINALFTATSAVCVTGLIVVDTGSDLTLMSQIVVMALIQLGGLGIMTAMTIVPFLMGQRIGIRQRFYFIKEKGLEHPSGAVKLLIQILKVTILFEAIGFVPLFIKFSEEMSHKEALFTAAFHSISAFCNAGFSLFSNSLESYSNSFMIPGAIMFLIILGGLGFPFYMEWVSKAKSHKRLSPYAKLVLSTTAMLIIFGTLTILFAEWEGAFAEYNLPLKLWNALFMAVTPRTAGFDTISPSSFSKAGYIIIVLLMIIGASPASTGGGIKTTTAGVLWCTVKSNLRGKKPFLFNQSISSDLIVNTTTLITLYLTTIFVSVVLLSLFEPFSFDQILFEVVSALGTVGLSLGITPHLSSAGKLVLVILMFWGRVGLITFMYSVFKKREKENINLPRAYIPIG